MKIRSKFGTLALTFSLFLFLAASFNTTVWGQAPQDPGALGIEEVFELNEAPQVEPPPGTQPPEVEPDGDGLSDKEREEAAAAARTDPRAETPDQILGSAPEPPPPPQTEGLIGESAIVRSFAGIDYPASGSIIPDPSVAKSPNHVLEATNGMLRLTKSDGTAEVKMSMDAFFGLSGQAAGTTDPKVYFDNLGPTKVFVIAVMGKGTPRGLHLAVSRNPDPENLSAPASWCRFSLPHPTIAPQVLADYPGLGAGPEHLILTSNHFGPTNSGTLIRLIAKNVLYNITDTTKSCPLTVASISVLPLLSDSTGANLRTLQPVQFSTAPGSAGGVTTLGYLVSAVDYRTTEYRIWSLQRNSAGALVRPLPSRVVQASRVYLLPPPAYQPPTPSNATNSVSTGDGRILQAVGSGNTIWFTQTTGCHIMDATANDSCANVLQVNVTPGAGDPQVTFGQQSILGAGAGISMWHPAIAMTPTGHVALVYHQGSASLPMSLAVAVKRASTMLFRALPLDQGACSQTGINLRAGDYLGAQVDPSGASFWMAGEKLFDFDPDPAPQRVNCKWATFVKEVRP